MPARLVPAPSAQAPALDLIAIGRVSVDLYGQQIGSPLEEVATFLKAVGGCPANVAIGAARLGLKAALITRVGEEPMGRFVREQLVREGVDVRGVHVDAQRLTALVLLSVRDEHTFPLIFYRENCADAALAEEDVDAEFVAEARAVLLTGTHFSLPRAAQAQRKAMAIAKSLGRRVILDIDYRPNLWGIGGHAAGESRYARSARVTAVLAQVLPQCDLIVGTEEELHIAGGQEETLAAIRRIRELSDAVIVCKRGARGCVVFAGAIPASVDEGLVSEGRAIEIYNVLGAGDAFLAGYLRGYLREAPHEECARLANACGALAVSRLLCSAEFPTLPELEHYLAAGSRYRALREDPWLNHLHRVTTRRNAPRELLVLALDECAAPQAEEADAARGADFRRLVLKALSRVRAAGPAFGVRLGAREEAVALNEAARAGLWVAQAVERRGPRTLELAHADSLAVRLTEWPVTRTVSCRCQVGAADLPELRAAEEASLLRLAGACRALGREFLLELQPRAEVMPGPDGAAAVLTRLYALGIRPDWWALTPQEPHMWERCARVIADNDAYCRGVLLCVRGLDGVAAALNAASESGLVQGLLAGGTILEGAARGWLSGEMSDEATIAEVSSRLSTVIELWTGQRAREAAPPRVTP